MTLITLKASYLYTPITGAGGHIVFILDPISPNISFGIAIALSRLTDRLDMTLAVFI